MNEARGPANVKPWLFLDVDGVVSPIRRINRQTGASSTNLADYLDPTIPEGYRTWPRAPYDMYVDQRLSTWAAILDDCYRVMWCTDWQRMAPRLIGRPAGLPDWPYLTFDSRRDGRGRVGHKAIAIARTLTDDPAPFAWADDHLRADGRLPPGLGRLTLPHLLIRPRLPVGLTEDHVGDLVRFAQAHTS